MREQWLRPLDAVSIAVERVEGGDDDADVLGLAGVLSNEEYLVDSILSKIAERIPGNSEPEARRTWMRVMLLWLYEHRESVSDPLEIVEEIYADFGYPEEIRHLVRYEPTADASPVDPGGANSIMEKLASYVAACGRGTSAR